MGWQMEHNTDPDHISQEFPNANLWSASESPRKLMQNNNPQVPHTDVSDSVFLVRTQGSVFLRPPPLVIMSPSHILESVKGE